MKPAPPVMRILTVDRLVLIDGHLRQPSSQALVDLGIVIG